MQVTLVVRQCFSNGAATKETLAANQTLHPSPPFSFPQLPQEVTKGAVNQTI